MSERENIQLVRQTYQQVSTGDIPTFLKLFHATVEWRVPRMEGAPFAGTWKGRDDVAQFSAKVAAVRDANLGDRKRGCFGLGACVDPHHGEIVSFYEYVDTAAVTRAHAAAASHSYSDSKYDA